MGIDVCLSILLRVCHSPTPQMYIYTWWTPMHCVLAHPHICHCDNFTGMQLTNSNLEQGHSGKLMLEPCIYSYLLGDMEQRFESNLG